MNLILVVALLAGQAVPAQQTKKTPAPHAPESHHPVERPRTLTGYVDQEKVFLEYLLKRHPICSVHQKNNRLTGKPVVSDRQEEFVKFGGAGWSTCR